MYVHHVSGFADCSWIISIIIIIIKSTAVGGWHGWWFTLKAPRLLGDQIAALSVFLVGPFHVTCQSSEWTLCVIR